MIAQVNKQQQIQREKDKVAAFTPEEWANMQLSFYEQTKKLELTPELNAEYERIFYTRIHEMSRLNDKDKALSDKEIKVGFDRIVDEMNAEMKTLLDQERYVQHLENFGKIIRSVYRRMNWNN